MLGLAMRRSLSHHITFADGIQAACRLFLTMRWRASHRIILRMLTVSMPARRLSLDDKFKLCRSIAEECIQDSELRNLLDKKPNVIAYDGFEPSGRMHIAQVCRTSTVVLLPL